MTGALIERLRAVDYHDPPGRSEIRLCHEAADALQKAEEERDGLKESLGDACEASNAWMERANKAEARIAKMEAALAWYATEAAKAGPLLAVGGVMDFDAQYQTTRLFDQDLGARARAVLSAHERQA